MNRAHASIVMLAASAGLSGCANLPLVGNLGERIAPMLPAFVRDRLFPAQAQAGPADGAQSPDAAIVQHRHPIPAQVQSAATGTGSAPIATEDPQVVQASEVAVNIQFDHLRTLGLEDLYLGQTAQALKSFQEALALRPGDKNVDDLIGLIQHPPASDLGLDAWGSGASPKTAPETSFANLDQGSALDSGQSGALAPPLPQPPSGLAPGGQISGSSGAANPASSNNPEASLMSLPPSVQLKPVAPPPSKPAPVIRAPAFQVPIPHR